MERRCTNNRAVNIDASIVPTSQAAVQMYNGTLTIEQQFGIDTLGQQPAKKDAREREFRRHFPRVDTIFHAIVNDNHALFRNAILYYIQLTRYLSNQ